jgi:hypothetical protein
MARSMRRWVRTASTGGAAHPAMATARSKRPARNATSIVVRCDQACMVTPPTKLRGIKEEE